MRERRDSMHSLEIKHPIYYVQQNLLYFVPQTNYYQSTLDSVVVN